MDAGMAGLAKAHEVIPVEGESSHLFFGSGGLDGDDVMHTPGTRHDALLQTFFAQSVGAPEFGNAQLLPLAAVIDVGLVLGYLVRYSSPVMLLSHGALLS